MLPEPAPLEVSRVEWLAATPEAIEVRVVGRLVGAPVLEVGEERFPAATSASGPARSATFLVRGDLRAALEVPGGASLLAGAARVALPAAVPGPSGTVVDPAVLAWRRARRARVVSSDPAVETLRTRLGQVEDRLASAGAERDRLAARLADAERRLRRAEQTAEAERRRRDELETETGGAVRVGYERVERLRASLAAAEEAREELRAELRRLRASGLSEAEREELARLRTRAAAGPSEAEVARLREELAASAPAAGEAERLREHVHRLRARVAAAPRPEELVALREEATRLREQLAAAPDARDVERLREQLAAAPDPAELARLRDGLAAAPDPGELTRLREALEAAPDPGELTRLREALAAAPDRDEFERLREALSAAPDPRDVARLREMLAAAPDPLEVERLREASAAAPDPIEVERLREALAAAPDPHDVKRLRELLAAAPDPVELAQLREALAAAPDPIELARLREALAAAPDAAEVERLRAELAAAPDPVKIERLRAELARAEREVAEQREAVRVAESRAEAAREAGESRLQATVDALAEELRSLRAELARLLSQAAPLAPEAELAVLDDPAALDAALRVRRDADDERPDDDAGPSALDALLAGLHEDAAPPRGPVAGLDDATRSRLEAIEAQARERREAADGSLAGGLADAAARLRAAVPRAPAAEAPETAADPPAEVPPSGAAAPAAAVRSAAADPPAAEPPVAAAGPTGAVAMTPAVAPAPAVAHPRVAPLLARPLPVRAEGPWLRLALERLAVVDPALAARLLVALLPAQAAVADGLTYDVAVAGAPPVRVALAGGRGWVDPAPAAGPVDVAVAGDVRTLAPLAAGGAGRWRLRGARVTGSRRRLRALLRARRTRVGLAELAAAGLALDPALLLASLAAATPPHLTRGQSFGVAYDVDGDAHEVRAADGAPLAVTPGRTTRVAAIVHVARPALPAVLAGGAPASPRPATVTGDPVAVALLHGWFDVARGVARA